MPDAYPLYLPSDARRLFQSESLLRRFAQTAQWGKAPRLGELHGSLGGLALTKATGGTLTVIDSEAPAAEALKERARIAGLADKVTFQSGSTVHPELKKDSFDGLFSLGRVVGDAPLVARMMRPALARHGRLLLTCVVKVSLAPASASVKFWESRLGQPLRGPRDTMMAVEGEGFEPELMDSLSDEDLDGFYSDVEASLAKVTGAPEGLESLKAEIATHRAQAGKSGVAYAVLIARRRESGEKPPASRDSG